MDESDYFSPKSENSFMSYSQFVDFKNCEACALAKIRGEWKEEETTAMLVGSYLDARFSGDKDFSSKHPEIFKKDGSLKAEFAQAETMIESVEKDSYFASYFKGEMQVIETGEIAGVPFKIKMDSVFEDKIVDIKTARSVDDQWSDKDGGRVPFWRLWRYDIQAAVYQEIHAQNTGKRLPFYLAVVTKEDYPNRVLVRFSDATLKAALEEVRSLAPKYQAIKEGKIAPNRCGSCDYCKSTKILSDSDIIIA